MSVFKTEDSRLKTLEVKVERLEKQVREIFKIVGKPVSEPESEDDDDYCVIS